MVNKNILQQSVGVFIKKGQRSKSEKLLLTSIRHLQKEIKGRKGLESFLKGVEVLSPLIDLVSKKKAGTTFKIPVPIKKKRQVHKGLIWAVENRNKGVLREFPVRLESVLKEEQLDSRLSSLYSTGKTNRVHIRFLNKKLKA